MQTPTDSNHDRNSPRELKLSALRLARYQRLEDYPCPFLLPVIKLGERGTYAPWETATCPAVVVKVQDLLFHSGLTAKPILDNIQHASGIHHYLNFDGKVILSSIMRDKTIRGFTPEAYAAMIRALKPDYYFTPDGETYFGEEHLSQFEISRILSDTKYLLDADLESKPIGLVKGCNLAQVESHVEQLLNLGVSLYAFHAGDFICRGTSNAMTTAKSFAKLIRRKVPKLIIYGAGANSHFLRFSFADGFVTQSHFVSAFYGKKMVEDRWVHFKGAPTRDIIMQNLRAMEENLIDISVQPGLRPWLEPDEMSSTAMIIEYKKDGRLVPGVD